MFKKIRIWGKLLAQSARLMVGVRDYESYLRHHSDCHSDTPALSREEFVRACQDARYSDRKRITRCPC